MSSSLLYGDDELDEFDLHFDPSHFDDIEEPPPVHILYPRPTYSRACSIRLLSNHLVKSYFLSHFNHSQLVISVVTSLLIYIVHNSNLLIAL